MITVDEVKALLNVPISDTRDDLAFQAALDASHAFIAERCSVARTQTDSSLWPADLRSALVLMVSRLHARRSSPGGLDLGGLDSGLAARISGVDPDVRALMAPYRDWCFS